MFQRKLNNLFLFIFMLSFPQIKILLGVQIFFSLIKFKCYPVKIDQCRVRFVEWFVSFLFFFPLGLDIVDVNIIFLIIVTTGSIGIRCIARSTLL